mmetsp:Transcript_15685/g.28340  ORF Transcript_15685/g.28340 Transcript_15685/m.28340 type:complete len:421 (-) Transcript_15685:1115-2377(-)
MKSRRAVASRISRGCSLTVRTSTTTTNVSRAPCFGNTQPLSFILHDAKRLHESPNLSRLTARRSFSSFARTSQENTGVAFLKNMIKPFFLKCHPDVQLTSIAKRVNLRALQTVNGLLDATHATLAGRHVEWPSSSLQVEFLITVQERVKKDIIESTSRRQVELSLPPASLREAVVQSSHQNSPAHCQLQHHVRLELAKLLKVAGLPVPVVMHEHDTSDVWNEELDFMGDTTNKSRTFTSRYQQSRQAFVQSVDWKRIQRLTQEAVADMEADLATEGSIRNHAKRRQDVITNILSKVRVEHEMPVLDQLICFRRLSLILEDNFDDLYMEDMGKMWENLVIVLKGPREYNTSSSAIRKRTKRLQETGYQFSYATTGVVTIHIPIDFTDEELVTELDRNLWDFYNIVGNGVEELYPKWFTEQS